MAHECGKPRPGLEPEGTFVIQLRSNSNLEQRRLSGRVEHVVSGDSEPFASLDALLGFMARSLNRNKASRGT